MRAVAVSVWIFINLVFVGMCGYVYLLWSQYWRYVERQNGQLVTVLSPGRGYGYGSYSGSAAAAAAAAAGGGGSAGGQVYYYYHHGSSSGEASGTGGAGDNRTLLPKHRRRQQLAAAATAAARPRRGPGAARFPQQLPPQQPASASAASASAPASASASGATGCEAASAECGADAAADASGRSRAPLDRHLQAKVASYKGQLVVQLRRVLLEEGSVFRAGRGARANPYHVNYAGPRGSYAGRTPRELVCELHQAAAGVRALRASDQPFARLGLGALFPTQPLLPTAPAPGPGPARRACAVVTNAGALAGSGLGPFIDKHDLVLRFNHAPTLNYERDVGSKTTVRIVNSQVVSKPEFDFAHSPLYEDVALLVWDPSNYSASLDEWFAHPDFELFEPYFEHRRRHPLRNFHVLDPRALWALWEFIQSHTPVRIRKNPPSSGFLGLALLLPHCAYVDLFEYVPSMRLTKRCHYWETSEDLSCTFGVWHPLAAEKLLALALNVASDQAVYTTGYIRVLGYDTLRC